MFEISMDKRYDNFIATICNCATPTNAQTDEEFRYILFEVLGVDVFTVFSEKNLGDLIKEERIRPEDKEPCLRIRVLFEQNENRWRNLGSVNEIQEDRAFTEIRRIAGTLLKTYCGYSLLDSETENKLWNKIDREYQFSPAYEKTPYPWIQIPSPCRSFSVKAVWDDKQEALVNSFFDQLGVSKLNVLDWQHDCFSFCPNDFGKLVKEYYDDERNCNVYFPSYYPDGDYFFFIDQDGKYALFGHPWLHEIVVYGQELIDLFEENKRALELGELFIQRVDVEDDYTRDDTMI